MPLLQYFGWVGSVLLAALFAANWCYAPPAAPAPNDIPLDQKINIRIHTERKWPERVVFDTTHSSVPPAATAEPEANIGPDRSLDQAEHRGLDAFAEMAAMPAKPCFRRPCSASHVAERAAAPSERSAPVQDRARSPIVAGRGVIFPSPLHKPPGRS